MPKTRSGQEPRRQRSADDNDSTLPGVNGNAFEDTSKEHINWEGGNGLHGGYSPINASAAAADIAKKYGVSETDARDMFEGVRSFTGSGYTSIRAAQRNGDTEGYGAVRGQNVEKFISKGIASGYGWNGGTTYRGIAISDAALSNITAIGNGEKLDIQLGGSASWATRVGVSEGFAADHAYGNTPNKVVFVNLDKSQRGVSVAGISTCGYGEREVLCSKDAQYKKVAQRKIGDYTYVYVRNA